MHVGEYTCRCTTTMTHTYLVHPPCMQAGSYILSHARLHPCVHLPIHPFIHPSIPVCLHACTNMFICVCACKYVCTYVAMCTCIYVCMDVDVITCICFCVRKCTHICSIHNMCNVHVHVHVYLRVYVCIYSCTAVCMYVCMHGCMYVCMYAGTMCFASGLRWTCSAHSHYEAMHVTSPISVPKGGSNRAQT